MMFVNKEYQNYKYLISASDNYVVLARQRNVTADWNNPRTIDVVYQYINPSTLSFQSTRTFTNSVTFDSIDVSDNYYDRADCPSIIIATFCVIFFVLFFLNGLTRFVKKGGVFFGN